jgi:hypothetical protein
MLNVLAGDFDLINNGSGPTALAMALAGICPSLGTSAISHVTSGADNRPFNWLDFHNTLTRLDSVCPTNSTHFTASSPDAFRDTISDHLGNNRYVIVLLGVDGTLPENQRRIFTGYSHYILLIQEDNGYIYYLNPGDAFNARVPANHLIGEIMDGGFGNWQGFALW